jgi:hypothetical protein
MSRAQATTKRAKRTTAAQPIETPFPTPKRGTQLVFTPCGHQSSEPGRHNIDSHLIGRFAYCADCKKMRIVEKVV